MTKREEEAALKVQQLLMDLTLLDPEDPGFPVELRRLGRAFIDVADVMEQVQAERKPS